MATCVGNIPAENYYDLIIVPQVTIDNVGDPVLTRYLAKFYDHADNFVCLRRQANGSAGSASGRPIQGLRFHDLERSQVRRRGFDYRIRGGKTRGIAHYLDQGDIDRIKIFPSF